MRTSRILLIAAVAVAVAPRPAAADPPADPPPATAGQSPADLAGPDFDGDGYADLAIGSPGDHEFRDGASVTVLHGGATGLGAQRSQYWTVHSPGMPPVEESPTGELTYLGRALAWGDFDADGYADLAMGAPYETVEQHGYAGTTRVLYGSPAGLTTARAQLWSRSGSSLPGDPNYSDFLGKDLISGDFNGDAMSDLAILVGGRGTIHVVYGSADGLVSTGSDVVLTETVYVEDIAAGDFDGDGDDELVIGRPRVGPVLVYQGTPDGVDPESRQRWSQATKGVLGKPGDEHFGTGVIGADLDADGFEDLVVLVTGDGLEEGRPEEGTVQVIFGSASGLTPAGDRRIRFFELADGEFAFELPITLSSGDVDGDGHVEVVVGDPFTNVVVGDVTIEQAGSAVILNGTPGGIRLRGSQVLTQATAGSVDPAEAFDRAGGVVTLGDYDGDGLADLAAEIAGERPQGTSASSGAVHVWYGASSGLTTDRDQIWSQDSPGIEGVAGDLDFFGDALS